jgi:rhodanese-related sulfurtransferase
MKIVFINKLGNFLSIIVVVVLILSTLSMTSATIIENNKIINQNLSENSNFNYIDITVEEAYILLTDTSNGIQIPIDVRTDDEWKTEHIVTPSPENPKHHCYFDWDTEEILNEFITLYDGNEIIIYCKSGGRSRNAAEILVENNFSGIIYNMLGGITAWKEFGYPTMPNTPPDLPSISGDSTGKPETSYDYTFNSVDQDGDDVFICVDWNDTTGELCYGPFSSDQDVILNYTWAVEGTYIIKAKATRDIYGDESNWSTLEVQMPKLILKYLLMDWISERFPIFFQFLESRKND